MDIQVGDIIYANGYEHVVTSEPYIPNEEDLKFDSAIDENYIQGEYVIPVDSGGIIYESEIDRVCKMTKI